MGVVGVESVNEPLRSKTGDSMNILPRERITNSLIKMISFSYLSSLQMIIFWKLSSFSYKFSGSFSRMGFYAYITFFQMAQFAGRVISFKTFLNGGVRTARSAKSLQAFSERNDGKCSGTYPPPSPPLRQKFHSSSLMSPSQSNILDAIMKLQRSLSFSKRPLQILRQKLYVMSLISKLIRSVTFYLFSVTYSLLLKSFMKNSSEY